MVYCIVAECVLKSCDQCEAIVMERVEAIEAERRRWILSWLSGSGL
jgi:hypothetical protein